MTPTCEPVPLVHASGRTPASPAEATTGAQDSRRRWIGWMTLAPLLAGLAACGQRGPLYMPDPNDPTKKRS